MKRFSIVSFLASLLMPSIALAEGAANAVVGAGVGKCSERTENREHKNEMLDRGLATWVQGYLSGANTYRYLSTNRPMIGIPPYPELLDQIDKYCKENPEEETFIAAMWLYKSLLPEDSSERQEEKATPDAGLEQP